MALSKTTQDHEEIKQWAERRGAIPSEVASTHSKKEPGILRFAFPKAPNHNDSSLNELSWEDFFEKFDENGLELVYQEVTSEGAESNFNKLIYPTDDNHSSRHGKSSGSQSGAAKSSAKSAKSSGSTSKAAKSSGASSKSAKSSSPSSKSTKSSGSKSKDSHKAA
ncbi:MAG: hypothetical protein LC740_18315 [Actinobacteria bacterium]|nr:hypothetical protein [Actinomycetota bacterium]